MRFLFLIFLVLSGVAARADELGFRYASLINSAGYSLFDFTPEHDGKILEVNYRTFPVKGSFHDNIYLEGALGYRSNTDVYEYSSALFEASPGVKVEVGQFRFRLSQGAAYMPANGNSGLPTIEAVTHFSFGVQDPKTGIEINYERTHFSDGSDGVENRSLDYSGLGLQFSF